MKASVWENLMHRSNNYQKTWCQKIYWNLCIYKEVVHATGFYFLECQKHKIFDVCLKIFHKIGCHLWFQVIDSTYDVSKFFINLFLLIDFILIHWNGHLAHYNRCHLWFQVIYNIMCLIQQVSTNFGIYT